LKYTGPDDPKVLSVIKKYTDRTPNNDVYSVYEYYRDLSYGAITNVTVGYSISDVTDVSGSTLLKTEKSKQGDMKYQIFELLSGKKVDDYDISINLFAYHGGSSGGFFHPSIYYAVGLTTLTSDTVLSSVPHHEFFHGIGWTDPTILDLYLDDNVEMPMYMWDLMSINKWDVCTTNTWYKYKCGWVSDTVDSKKPSVMTLTDSGTYTIYPAYSEKGKTGTIAVKFGEKGNESFYAEIKAKQAESPDSGIPDSVTKGLFIYKVDKTYQGNLNGKNNYEVCAVRNTDSGTVKLSDYIWTPDTTCSKFVYHDGSVFGDSVKVVGWTDDGGLKIQYTKG
jgi:hypothetical protein